MEDEFSSAIGTCFECRYYSDKKDTLYDGWKEEVFKYSCLKFEENFRHPYEVCQHFSLRNELDQILFGPYTIE